MKIRYKINTFFQWALLIFGWVFLYYKGNIQAVVLFVGSIIVYTINNKTQENDDLIKKLEKQNFA